MAASQDGLLIDVLAVVLTAALAVAALYIVVGVALLPVWAAGALFRVDALRRVGGGWWFMPGMAREAAEDFIARFTAPRDGSRWTRKEPAVAVEPDPDRTGDWARGLGSVVLWVMAIVGGLVLFMEGHDAVVQPLAGGSAGEFVVITIIIITAGPRGRSLGALTPLPIRQPPACIQVRTRHRDPLRTAELHAHHRAELLAAACGGVLLLRRGLRTPARDLPDPRDR